MAPIVVLARQATILPRLTLERLIVHRPLQLPPAFQPIRIAAAALPILGTSFSNVGSWISGIWDSILKAVPKKKSSYSRKRTRQLTGKALKDIERVVSCTSCGRPKRPHVICANCLKIMTEMWKPKGDYLGYKPGPETIEPEANAQIVSKMDRPSLEAPSKASRK